MRYELDRRGWGLASICVVCRMPRLGLWARGFGVFEGFLTSWHMSGANMHARGVRA